MVAYICRSGWLMNRFVLAFVGGPLTNVLRKNRLLFLPSPNAIVSATLIVMPIQYGVWTFIATGLLKVEVESMPLLIPVVTDVALRSAPGAVGTFPPTAKSA